MALDRETRRPRASSCDALCGWVCLGIRNYSVLRQRRIAPFAFFSFVVSSFGGPPPPLSFLFSQSMALVLVVFLRFLSFPGRRVKKKHGRSEFMQSTEKMEFR